jgi:hypothetical protein
MKEEGKKKRPASRVTKEGECRSKQQPQNRRKGNGIVIFQRKHDKT